MSTLGNKLEELITETVTDTVKDTISNEIEDLRSELESEIEDCKYSCEQQVDTALSDFKDDILSEVTSDVESMVNECFTKKIQDWSRNEGLGLTDNDRRWINDLISAFVDEKIYKTLRRLVEASDPTRCQG